MLDELESNKKEYEVSFLVAEEGDAAEKGVRHSFSRTN